MTIDPTKYRGFDLNCEMVDGGFLPSFHDCLNPKHAGDKWARLPEAADPSKDRATAKAHDAIDKMVETEVARTVEQLAHAGVKVAP